MITTAALTLALSLVAQQRNALGQLILPPGTPCRVGRSSPTIGPDTYPLLALGPDDDRFYTKTFNELASYRKINDLAGIKEMEGKGQVRVVEGGVSATVIESRAGEMAKIRILDGKSAGKSAWARMSDLAPRDLPPAQKPAKKVRRNPDGSVRK